MRPLARWILFALAAGVVVWAMRVPPTVEEPGQKFLSSDLARIIFFHLPCAFAGTVYVLGGAVLSWRYLSSRDWKFEIRAAAANDMAFVLLCLTMATGILFSYVQWGAPWQSDPRQTSFLLVLLLLGAYQILRMAVPDDRRRAAAAAVYWVAALLPVLFLIFVFPRLPQVVQLSSHPSETVQGGRLKGEYGQVVTAGFAVLLGICHWMYRMRVRAGELAHAWENRNEGLDAGGGAAPTGVVRPLSVPTGNPEEAG